MELTFNWKHKDYEIRETTNPTSNEKYWELVKWQKYKGKPSCFTLASFVKGSEGWSLKFIGTRPFEYIDEDFGIVWDALKLTNETLNSYFKLKRLENN